MLTDTDCKTATCPPDKKRAREYDGQGLYLEVSPKGAKSWFLRLRIGPKDTRMALGSYPAVSLKEARLARDAARAQKAIGVNPIQERKAAKLKATVAASIDTFEVTALEWVEQQRQNWSDTHYARELRNIKKDLVPHLGTRPVSEIEPIELLAVLRKVEARGALVTASRVLSTAHSIFLYAVATSRAARDITPDLKRALKPCVKKNLPALFAPEEVAGLLRASDGWSGGPIIRAALAIAPILFQRPGNLRMMRWVDVDMDAALWTIPSEDMKRRKQAKLNGKPHLVPLPRQALAILRELHYLTGGGEWVFPGLRDAKKPMSEAGVQAALNAMGYKDRHCWHGYRAMGRTLIREVLGYNPDVIEAQLAHTGNIGHGGAYDRATHLGARTTMLQEWADYLDRLRTGADIIQLHSKAA